MGFEPTQGHSRGSYNYYNGQDAHSFCSFETLPTLPSREEGKLLWELRFSLFLPMIYCEFIRKGKEHV